MGHTSADACSVGAIHGQGIEVDRTRDFARDLEAPRQAVRRGAVRAPVAQVGPSRWEHVEMDLAGGLQAGMERVSMLVLEAGGGPDPGGNFWAAAGAFRQVDDRSCGEEVTRGAECFAGGKWTPCRGGVELIFAAELGLPELRVRYRLRRQCIVADEASLPDGLVQEYSRCSSVAEAVVSTPQLSIGDAYGGQDSSSAAIASNSGGDAPAGRSEVLPAGIIEEGASSGDEDFGNFGDGIVTAHQGVSAQQVNDNMRDQLVNENESHQEDESYPEDFEPEDGDEEADDS